MKFIATKTIDEIGRIVLPLSLRSKYQISADSEVDICIDDNGQIVLRKTQPCCAICNGADNLKAFDERNRICTHCRTKIKEIDE